MFQLIYKNLYLRSNVKHLLLYIIFRFKSIFNSFFVTSPHDFVALNHFIRYSKFHVCAIAFICEMICIKLFLYLFRFFFVYQGSLLFVVVVLNSKCYRKLIPITPQSHFIAVFPAIFFVYHHHVSIKRL